MFLNQDVHEISQGSDISEMILKEKINIFSNFLCGSFNSSIKSRKFPENFKLADIIPPHKKGKKDIKGNYRPVSILPTLSKIFEKCILTQMLQFFSNIFLKYQCGFRKSFSTQLSFLEMLEKLEMSVDNGKTFGDLLTDLSNAIDCLGHELLIAKLSAYGLSCPALKLIHYYLSNRK